MDQSPQVELNAIQVMEQRFQMLEEIALVQGRHNAELAPLLEAVRLAELFIKDTMNKDGAQQLKSALTGDSCNFTTKDKVTVSDMDAVVGYIVDASPVPAHIPSMTEELWGAVKTHLRGTAMWTLLNQAVNKTAVKDVIKETNAVPPGVEYSSFKDLAWKRGKGAPAAA